MANKSHNISIYAKPQPKGLSDKLLEMSFQLYISLASPARATKQTVCLVGDSNSQFKVQDVGVKFDPFNSMLT